LSWRPSRPAPCYRAIMAYTRSALRRTTEIRWRVSARRLPLRLILLLLLILPHLLQPRGDAGGDGLGLVLADVADDGGSDDGGSDVVGIVALDVEQTFGLLRELRLKFGDLDGLLGD